ncbi:hypothetical protein AAG570_004940 [Ranatra chinensis]|uniref:Uncharacterized protein n=1 Tax=Ranatra chinensis TaxID=642074 RepID=A0ABD0XZ05_9HEMI
MGLGRSAVALGGPVSAILNLEPLSGLRPPCVLIFFVSAIPPPTGEDRPGRPRSEPVDAEASVSRTYPHIPTGVYTLLQERVQMQQSILNGYELELSPGRRLRLVIENLRDQDSVPNLRG